MPGICIGIDWIGVYKATVGPPVAVESARHSSSCSQYLLLYLYLFNTFELCLLHIIMNGVSNKLVTLVTGANQGIGYHAARKLATSGRYYVLLGARDLSKGQKAAETIGGENIEALQIDVDSDASIKAAAETVEKKFGRLDIVSHKLKNYGISQLIVAICTARQ